MAISAAHRRLIYIDHVVIPVVLNFFINGIFAWAAFKSMQSVPLWGKKSLGVDLLITAFILPFIITIISSSATKEKIILKKVQPLDIDYLNSAGWLQCSPIRFGTILGLFFVVTWASPLVWILNLSQMQGISINSFILFKSVWSAMLALLVSLIVGIWVLINFSIHPP